MADAGTMFRTAPTKRSLGDYNGITRVGPSTTAHFTGSYSGAGFICENVSNVVITTPGGSAIPGTALTAKTLYPIGVEKVVNGSSGIVHVLKK